MIVSRSVKPEDFVDGDLDDEPSRSKFVAVAADITTQDGRSKVVQEVEKFTNTKGTDLAVVDTGMDGEQQQQPWPHRKQRRFVVHSAGTIDPIKPVRDVTPEDLQYAFKVNVEGPFFLSTALYDYMVPPNQSPSSSSSSASSVATNSGRVLHVSSGAAHGAPPLGWSVYGITKAAFFQSYKVLDRELSIIRDDGSSSSRSSSDGNTTASASSVRVGSFKPGVVDTSMQGVIRNADTASMPTVNNFRKMKDNFDAAVANARGIEEVSTARPPPKGALDTTRNVSFFAEWLLLGTTDDEFAKMDDGGEYDIRDASLFDKWIPKENLP